MTSRSQTRRQGQGRAERNEAFQPNHLPSPVVPSNASGIPPTQANTQNPPTAQVASETTQRVQCRWCRKSMVKGSKWCHEQGCAENPNIAAPKHECPKCGKKYGSFANQ
ncbi:hypothetical protein BD779DRAFT_1483089 [Infundibulicybe gibba]|nr:hypothetical protein BD779DRAFT_1483089 [Infundibulicybe gibba]